VGRHLLGDERDRLGAAGLAQIALRQPGALARAERHGGFEVRQREGRSPVAAEGRAEKREQLHVLADVEQLPVARRPAGREEGPRLRADLAHERLRAGRLRAAGGRAL
jgi:hypothetical protein